jgi:hypothetical protein
MATRVRDVQNQDDMQRVIDDFITTGYVVKEQGTNSTMLQKHTWGSPIGWIVAIVVALIVAIPTLGIGTVIILVAYPIIAHKTASKVLLRVQGQQGSVAPIVTE